MRAKREKREKGPHLPHAEVIIRAPGDDVDLLSVLSVPDSVWELTMLAVHILKDAVATLFLQTTL